jgi:predicted ATPase
MHLKRVTLFPEKFPTQEHYPFNLPAFHQTRSVSFASPVTFFVGENGTGKSTFLEAIAHRCGIHIWENDTGARVVHNPYEKKLYGFISAEWIEDHVPGSFFSGEMFRDFSRFLDEWAVQDPGMLDYFGGKSLLTQSHGQSLMSFFRARYGIKGLYLLDEPETALSPRTQLGLLEIIKEMGSAGHAQFIIATHSPILMACPGARIWSFDHTPFTKVDYEDTDHYRVYKGFMDHRERYVGGQVNTGTTAHAMNAV